MREELKPYEAYKETELEWLEKIPAHWDVNRAKVLFKKENRPVRIDDEVITCFRDGIVTLRKNRRTTGFTESLQEIGYQAINKGDLIIHAMDAFAGAIGVSDSYGKGSPVYNVCSTKTDLNSYYYAHIVREMALNGYIQSLSRGIRERSTDFRFDTFSRLQLPIPPKDEQDQIVRYLDYKLTKINRFIKAKKKQIELLKEQKQAIINNAVTKGLDPDVKMKSFGVEWLGDVPQNWDVVKIKYLTKKPLMYGANESGAEFIEEFPRYIRITDITSEGELKNHNKLSLRINDAEKYLLSEGDILLARSGATVGKTFIYRTSHGPCCFAGYLIKYSPNLKKLKPEYLFYYTQSGSYKLWLNQILILSTIQNVSAEKFKELHIPLPAVKEQGILIGYIEKNIQKIDESINLITKQLSLITEYRTSLISSVVTGKVDVRHIDIDDDHEGLEENLEDFFMELDELNDAELTEDEIMDEETA